MISTQVEKGTYTLKSLCGTFTISPKDSSFSFGRNPSCSFPVTYDRTGNTAPNHAKRSGGRLISPNHCELSYNQDAVSKETAIRCHVTGRHGVFVNGERIGKGNFKDLKSGDIIKLPTIHDNEADDLAFRFTMDDIGQAQLNQANMPWKQVINVWLYTNFFHHHSSLLKFLPL
jgi:pSer/pThr/pTyr-binding forkhead associated (FHA) protein